MEWWTDLWLNEGFASWIEYLCVDYCHPEFEIWTQFLAQDYAQALGLDALSNSHPIEVGIFVDRIIMITFKIHVHITVINNTTLYIQYYCNFKVSSRVNI